MLNHLKWKDLLLLHICEVGRHPANLGHSLLEAYIKDLEEGSCSLCPLALASLARPFLHWHYRLLLCFTSIYQIRRPASWTEQLLDSWPFWHKTVIVGPQPVSCSNKPLIPISTLTFPTPLFPLSVFISITYALLTFLTLSYAADGSVSTPC